jgi:hypothetical protein
MSAQTSDLQDPTYVASMGPILYTMFEMTPLGTSSKIELPELTSTKALHFFVDSIGSHVSHDWDDQIIERVPDAPPPIVFDPVDAEAERQVYQLACGRMNILHIAQQIEKRIIFRIAHGMETAESVRSRFPGMDRIAGILDHLPPAVPAPHPQGDLTSFCNRTASQYAAIMIITRPDDISKPLAVWVVRNASIDKDGTYALFDAGVESNPSNRRFVMYRGNFAALHGFDLMFEKSDDTVVNEYHPARISNPRFMLFGDATEDWEQLGDDGSDEPLFPTTLEESTFAVVGFQPKPSYSIPPVATIIHHIGTHLLYARSELWKRAF